VGPELSTRLEGRIVALEPLRPDHEEPLWEAASSDPRIWDWMHVRAGDDRGEFRRWFESMLTEEVAGVGASFATTDARSGTPVGHTRYHALRPADRVVEIGWTWIAAAYWDTGANVEAKYLMLRHAFEQLGFLRVEFKTDAKNERARRALAALPAQFEGVHRKHMLVRGGERRDSAWYSVIDDEWPEVRASLERRLARHP
jgi:RimJ/RimL family protein N-acetyltransferase